MLKFNEHNELDMCLGQHPSGMVLEWILALERTFSAVLQSFGAGLASVARMLNFKKVSVDSVDV